MNFDRTLDILFDESGSLKTLAIKSGIEPFSFYRGANLSEINLYGQDLTGLNFRDTDLRGANLENVKFDPGAFNGAILSPYAEILRDDFEFYLEDVLIAWHAGLYFFARFRPESIEDAISSTGLNYGNFAKISDLNLSTLRNARRGRVVSGDTANKICWGIRGNRVVSKGDPRQTSMFNELHNNYNRQPFVEVLTLHPTGGFGLVPRSELMDIIDNHPNLVKDLFKIGGSDMRFTYGTILTFKDMFL